MTPDETQHQRVTALGGVAYGAADATVYQHGHPGGSLLLGDWPDTPPGTDEPAHADLKTWLRSPESLAARWLYGLTPGQRTTAAQTVVARSRADGRRVVRPMSSDGPPLPSQQSTHTGDGATSAGDGGTYSGVTVIVDDADLLPLTALTWVFSNALLFSQHGPLRILLLAASLDGWPAVRAALANRAIWTDARTLPSPADGGTA